MLLVRPLLMGPTVDGKEPSGGSLLYYGCTRTGFRIPKNAYCTRLHTRAQPLAKIRFACLLQQDQNDVQQRIDLALHKERVC